MGSISQPPGPFKINRIAIIGAGPSGLAIAKYLLASSFTSITIYEQQSEVGGIWNYTRIPSETVSIPSTTPWTSPEPPSWPKGAEAPVFSNPMYDKLNTNIPKPLMQYSDQPFPDKALLYPSREDVQCYLIKYSEEIRQLISFHTQVLNVALSRPNSRDLWTLTTKSTINSSIQTAQYDAVVVSNGHYSIPRIPFVPGISAFAALHPGIITHSKIYRSPSTFRNKKVLVVGNAASGLDIATQISTVCALPLLNSINNPPVIPPNTSTLTTKREVPPIAAFLPACRGVRFEDGSVEEGIDAIVYCTGYLYSFPFLSSLEPKIVSNGRRVKGLYQQLFHIAHPTLVFPALSQKVIPFPLAEAQGAAIAAVWSNNLPLPSVSEMKDWEEKKVRELGDSTSFHVLGYPKDAEYINGLHDWVMSAEGGGGKEPPYWGEETCWIRDVYVDIKQKFVATGGTATSLEELGFVFAEGKVEK